MDKKLDEQLFWAAGTRNIATVRTLIDKGANVNAIHESGRTPLMWAADRHNNSRMIRFLIARGARPNYREDGRGSSEGRTALIYAAQREAPENVRTLLQNGADPNLADPLGATPLMQAAERGQLEAVRMLLARGARLNARTTGGETALMWALMREDFEYQGMRDQYTHRKNRIAMVRLLLARGADVNARTSEGRTALKIAGANKQKAIVALLKRAGAKQ